MPSVVSCGSPSAAMQEGDLVNWWEGNAGLLGLDDEAEARQKKRKTVQEQEGIGQGDGGPGWKRTKSTAAGGEKEATEIPKYLCCPIGLHLIEDPVVLTQVSLFLSPPTFQSNHICLFVSPVFSATVHHAS